MLKTLLTRGFFRQYSSSRKLFSSSSKSSSEGKCDSDMSNQRPSEKVDILIEEPACSSSAFTAVKPYSTATKMSGSSNTNSYEENSDSTIPNQFISEEWEELYEEAEGTSNALMAVLGHVPKDDKRICRFYDPKIDACFKGNNCRLQHIPLRKDYITKDTEPANVYAEIPTLASVQYEANQALKVTVTHIKNLEYFYGIVVDNSSPVEPFIWNDHDVPASDYLRKLPFTYDIVLAKFTDGLWYRAQVIDVDDVRKNVKVFYVDYGNGQAVPLKNLARCSEYIAKLPAQAQQFRLADVRIIQAEKEAQLRGAGMLCDMILNNDVDVTVVSHYEDLVVRFSHPPLSEIPQLLAELNCVELIEMLSI